MMSRWLGWLTLFLVGTDLFVMSPLLPAITKSLGVGPSAGGWAVSVFALAYLIGGPSFGALADRTSRRRIVVAALAAFLVANLATAASPTYTVLLAARAAAGLAASGITPSVYALVNAAAPPGARARWLATVTSGLLISLTAGAPLGSLLAGVVGWRGLFVVLASTLAVLLLLTARLTAPTPSPADAAVMEGRAEVPSLLMRLRAVSVTALWAIAVYGPYTFLGTILDERLAHSAGLVAAAVACFGVGAVTGNLVGGTIADRLGTQRLSVASLALLAGAQSAFAMLLPIGTLTLLPALALVALVAYPFFPAQQARLVSRYPDASGSLIAWNNTAMYAGIVVSSAAGSGVLTAAGPTALVLAAAGAAAVAAAIATVTVSPPGTAPVVTTTARPNQS